MKRLLMKIVRLFGFLPHCQLSCSPIPGFRTEQRPSFKVGWLFKWAL